MDISTLKLDESNVLIGSYPKILDIRDYKFKSDNIVSNFYSDFEKENLEGTPQADIHLRGDPSVEVIYFPNDETYFTYASIEDLPNLKEIHICNSSTHSLGPTLKWLICKNLPNLKTIKIDGEVFWLQMENVVLLETIDVRKNSTMDFFSIKNAPSLKKINVSGCKKLRKITDMSDDIQAILGVTEQILTNQKKSKNSGSLYRDMTFTDVDNVMANINNGVKLAVRLGVLEDANGGDDFCSGRENDSEFIKYSFRLLRPLENVYTGGSGETYTYENLQHGYYNSEYCIECSIGDRSQESCIEYVLSEIAGYLTVFRDTPSQKRVLNFLNKLVAQDHSHSPTIK